MEKIYDPKVVSSYINKSIYRTVLKDFQSDIFVIKYQEGELLTSPFQQIQLFQIVLDGKLNIYMIRDDGTRYSLSQGAENDILGDMEIFYPTLQNTIYSEACSDLTCIVFPIEENREKLLQNNLFLQLTGHSLSDKLLAITRLNATPATLAERVLTYMKYKCPNGVLKGIEQAAFHLHCSSRQLQRILNQYETDGIVQKIGKGTYLYHSDCGIVSDK